LISHDQWKETPFKLLRRLRHPRIVNGRQEIFIKFQTASSIPKIVGVALRYTVKNALPHFAAIAQRIHECGLILVHV
jgi:hypothetical protein